MRVFVECYNCGEKIYLEDIRDRRNEYPANIQLECSNCGSEFYYAREDIHAEPSGNSTAAGAIIGGAAGALAGPIGVPIGAGIGSILGQNADQEEKENIDRFYGRDSGIK